MKKKKRKQHEPCKIHPTSEYVLKVTSFLLGNM